MLKSFTFPEDIIVVEAAQKENLLTWQSEHVIFVGIVGELDGSLSIWISRTWLKLVCSNAVDFGETLCLGEVICILAKQVSEPIVKVTSEFCEDSTHFMLTERHF